MINNFKIRCSQIGLIMTNARSKDEVLSQTTKSYLEDWAKEQIYGRKKEIKSKYFDKGNMVESASIDFISEHLKLGMLFKNDEFFENDFLTGTPDLIPLDEIIDMKNPWDCFSFPLFKKDLPEKNHYYQVQGYMALTDKKKARVIYTLMNTPEELVEKELKSHFFNADEWDTDQEAEIRSKHSYDSVPVKYRIKEFAVYRDDEVIQKIYDRVIECRKYIETL